MAQDAKSLVAIARQWSAERPDDRAYIFLGRDGSVERTLTFSELDRRARGIADTLLTAAAPGDRALLMYPPGLEFIEAFLGCMYAGIVAVPVVMPRRSRLHDASIGILKDCAPRIGLTTASEIAAITPLVDQVAPSQIRWLATDVPSLSGDYEVPLPDLSRLAFLQYTSGSTSSPKGVMVSHGNIGYHLDMVSEAYQLGRHSTRVSWLPLHHDMGLVFNALHALHVGALCVLMAPTSFVQRPRIWLDAIHTYRAELAMGPNAGYELCVDTYTPQAASHLDLSCWKLAINGAEPVRAETLERFAQTFKPHGFDPRALHPGFGQAESTLVITGGRFEKEPLVCTVSSAQLRQNRFVLSSEGETQRLVGCGRVLPREEIAIVEPTTRHRLASNEIGEIWVAGAHVAHGYWQNAEATQHTFGATIVGEGARTWLRTGDLGCLDESGELFITGRLKDILIVRGQNFYPQDLERVAEDCHLALRRGYSAAFLTGTQRSEGQLVIACEVKEQHRDSVDISEVEAKVRQAVVQEFNLRVHEVVLVPQGSMPRTSSGKVRRQPTHKLWETGGLERLTQASASLVAEHN